MFHVYVRIFDVTSTVENFLKTKQGKLWQWQGVKGFRRLRAYAPHVLTLPLALGVDEIRGALASSAP